MNRTALRGPQQEQSQEQEQQQGISLLRHVLIDMAGNSLRFTDRRPMLADKSPHREDDCGSFPATTGGGCR